MKRGKWTTFKYYMIYGASYLLSLLPFRVLYFLSDVLFGLVYHVVKYRRDVVRSNLSDSFPEKDVEEIVRIERDFYHFFCDYVVETLIIATGNGWRRFRLS